MTVTTGIAMNALPEADVPLDGTEIVPIMQSGVAKQVSAHDLADTAHLTVVTGSGGITSTQTVPHPPTYNVSLDVSPGLLNVPVLVAATRNITATDAGKGIVQAAAAAVTLTIVADATENLGDGFVTTIACSNAGGSVIVGLAGGVTLTNLNDGTTGSKTITGVGIATLWRLGANSWGIHGSQNLA